MPSKHRIRRTKEPFIHAVISAALGMGLTLLLLCFAALLIIRGHISEGKGDLWLMLSVGVGCALSTAIYGRAEAGIIPGVLITSASYLLLVLLVTSMGQKGSIPGPLFVPVAASALLGSAIGMVTNFGKSNKSYIIKSKRKRKIT